jgi:hypothetical protein
MYEQAVIQLRVVSITPVAVYQDEVYTQMVRVEHDEYSWGVLDSDLLADSEHVGKVCKLWLRPFLGTIKIQSDALQQVRVETHLTRPGTPIYEKMGRTIEYDQVALYGKVVAVDKQWGAFLLDVGDGTLDCAVGPSAQVLSANGERMLPFDELEIGDFIVHYPARIDLKRIASPG